MALFFMCEFFVYAMILGHYRESTPTIIFLQELYIGLRYYEDWVYFVNGEVLLIMTTKILTA